MRRAHREGHRTDRLGWLRAAVLGANDGIISIAGLVAMTQLPIAQYPQVTPIQIQVSATYPGANGTLVAQNVGAPIEQQVNGANNMLYMSSTSSSTGNYTLNVYFDISTDPDLAQVDVQNRVSQALSKLPQAVQAQGVKVQQKTSSFLMVLAFYSPDGRQDPNFIANYTNTQILGAVNRIPGANQASILGVPDYAMRIWLKPDRMQQMGISASEISDAIKMQNQQFAVGRIGAPPTEGSVVQTFPATTRSITEPAEFNRRKSFATLFDINTTIENPTSASTHKMINRTRRENDINCGIVAPLD